MNNALIALAISLGVVAAVACAQTVIRWKTSRQWKRAIEARARYVQFGSLEDALDRAIAKDQQRKFGQ
jgi:hypothetical protein